MDILSRVTPEIKEKFLPLAKNLANELAIGDDAMVLREIQQALGQAYVLGLTEGNTKQGA